MYHDTHDANNPAATHYEYVIPATQQQQRFVTDIKTEAFAYMRHLDGWCSEQKASVLIDIICRVRPKKIVEIGVWGGKSLIPMACALRANECGKIFGIDPWDSSASLEEVMHESNRAYWSYADHELVYSQLKEKISTFTLQDYIQLIRSTSEAAPDIIDIDILHIDGNHSEKTSYFDVIKWVPHVKPGGWIIFDDMTWYENGIFTTARAIEWLNTHCIKFAQFNDNCTWGIWIKP
ncbi:MAG TPA: class I SAM-dependent methyltransferase [Rhabdochlamydiaceae bacterium]|jgi:predicted O-methyltransferase YrrM